MTVKELLDTIADLKARVETLEKHSRTTSFLFEQMRFAGPHMKRPIAVEREDDAELR